MSNKRGLYGKFKNEIKAIRDNSVISYIKRPDFQMSGNRELFAEGAISIEIYKCDNITLTASGVKLSVKGRGLSMCFYNSNKVKITGFFQSIDFE